MRRILGILILQIVVGQIIAVDDVSIPELKEIDLLSDNLSNEERFAVFDYTLRHKFNVPQVVIPHIQLTNIEKWAGGLLKNDGSDRAQQFLMRLRRQIVTEMDDKDPSRYTNIEYRDEFDRYATTSEMAQMVNMMERSVACVNNGQYEEASKLLTYKWVENKSKRSNGKILADDLLQNELRIIDCGHLFTDMLAVLKTQIQEDRVMKSENHGYFKVVNPDSNGAWVSIGFRRVTIVGSAEVSFFWGGFRIRNEKDMVDKRNKEVGLDGVKKSALERRILEWEKE